MIRGRVIAAAALSIGALAIAGCSGGSKPKDPLASYYTQSPPAAPITFSAKPLWTGSPKAVMETVDQVDFRGDVAIMRGENTGDTVWAAVDAGTGRVLWSHARGGPKGSLPDGASLDPDASFLVVGGADDWKVLVLYAKSPCTSASRSDDPATPCQRAFPRSTQEHGILALSGKDGSVLWQRPIAGGPVPTADPGDDFELSERLVGGVTDTVVVDVLSDVAADRDEEATVAVDTDDGTIRWQHPHSQAEQMTGGVVFQAPAALPDGTKGIGVETAVDALTGATRWSLPSGQQAGLVAGGTVLTKGIIAGLDSESDPQNALQPSQAVTHGSFLDAATGRKIADLPAVAGTEASLDFCTSDHASMIYCWLSPALKKTPRGQPLAFTRQFLTYSDADHRIRASKGDVACGPLAARYPDLAEDGRVFCPEYQQPSQVIEIDSGGHTLASGLPGSPLAISDHYAVFGTGDGYPMSTFAVYGVAKQPAP